MSLPEDLQRILNVGAKIYDTKSKRLGKVVELEGPIVTVDYGTSAKAEINKYTEVEFSQLLIEDSIVSQSRLTVGNNNNFKVRPRINNVVISKGEEVRHTGSTPNVQQISKPQVESINSSKDLEFGFVNFKNGKFSKTNKRGYTKIEYRKVKETVTLELTGEDIAKLKEMGIL